MDTISAVGLNNYGISPVSSSGEQENVSTLFSDMLTGAVRDAEEAYLESSADTQALLSGEVDDLAQVMISGTKSELALTLVVQVRDKVVEAYNQIMNMQV